jgi:hypothetical protein
MVVTEENRSNERKPYRSATSSTTNPMRHDQVERQVTSRLIHGTAQRAISGVPTPDGAPASSSAFGISPC